MDGKAEISVGKDEGVGKVRISLVKFDFVIADDEERLW